MDSSFSRSLFALNENNNLLEPKQTQTNNSLENNARDLPDKRIFGPPFVSKLRMNELA